LKLFLIFSEKGFTVLSKRNTFALFITGLFLFNILNATIEIAPSNLFIPTSLKGTRLFHEDGNFVVVKDGNVFPVKPEYLDKELRNLSDEELDFVLGLKAKININDEEIILTRIAPSVAQEIIAATDNEEVINFSAQDTKKITSQLPVSGYIQVLRYENGEFGLHLRTRWCGGGFFGGWVGAMVCKFIVSGVLHGGIAVISAAAGPAAPFVWAGLESTVGSSIEALSTAAALAGGITGAVITGPV
jgi:hypothetical protein